MPHLALLFGAYVLKLAVLERKHTLRKAYQKRHVGTVVHALEYANGAFFDLAACAEIKAAQRSHRFSNFHRNTPTATTE